MSDIQRLLEEAVSLPIGTGWVWPGVALTAEQIRELYDAMRSYFEV